MKKIILSLSIAAFMLGAEALKLTLPSKVQPQVLLV